MPRICNPPASVPIIGEVTHLCQAQLKFLVFNPDRLCILLQGQPNGAYSFQSLCRQGDMKELSFHPCGCFTDFVELKNCSSGHSDNSICIRLPKCNFDP